jgi:hypothetical protein
MAESDEDLGFKKDQAVPSSQVGAKFIFFEVKKLCKIVDELDATMEQVNESINDFNRNSSRLSGLMIVLSVLMLVAIGVQIYLGLH